MIVIINYGMGNLGSIINMFKKIGVAATISSTIREIEQAEKLVLPGVGAFDNAVTNINGLGLVPLLNRKVLQQKTPILGICLGMQLFARRSKEGKLPGLGWIDADVEKFNFEGDTYQLKIPHMGWNHIKTKRQNSLFNGLEDESRFYFVHSYHTVCNDKEDALTETFYGYNFPSSIQRDNIIGVQFHPEKSHKFGMKLLKNFIEYF